MSVITPVMPPAWVPPRIHRMTLQEYERMVAAGFIPSHNRIHLINGYMVDIYGPAGIPACWIIDVRGRRVEVYTGPGPQGYGSPTIFGEGQSVPVVIDGREVGRSAVDDILPPHRPRAQAEGNGA